MKSTKKNIKAELKEMLALFRIWASNKKPRYYKRDNTPYTGTREEILLQWVQDLENIDCRMIKKDILSDGKVVSTVWLGLNHNFGDGSPLIFETLVFPTEKDWTKIDGLRYSTEAEALIGHDKLKEKWSKP